MKKAVIFDMDGIIIDSEPLWSEAIRNMLKKRGFEYDDKSKVKFMGGGLDPELLYYKEKFNLSESVEEMKNDLIDIVLSVFDQKLVAKNGVIELIERLFGREYRLALATSSPARVMNYVVDKLKISDYFEVKATDDEVDSPKPAPDIYLLTAQKLSLDPGDCVAIEDSINGVRSAKSAGMKAIGLENEYVKANDFVGADLVVSNFEAITEESLR